MSKILLLFLLTFFLIPDAFSQVTIQPDHSIKLLIEGISRDSLQSYIRTLVSFGTRHTLSSQTDPDHGIGAARNWVLHKFQQDALQSNGRMTARIDTWIQPADHQRINRAVLMGNVIATIKGTDPNDDRIFIVSGHLDSRCSDIMDSTDAAPGANDDGSGVAAVLEMARLLSRFPLKATVVLVAVTGEEQGLFGSTHLAEEAKEEHWNIADMINNDMIGNSVSSGTDKHDNTKVRVFSEGIPYVETAQEERLRKALAGENDSKSRELARYIKAIGDTYVDNLTVELIYRRDRFLRGGDHIPFQERGYIAVRLTDFYENYNHQHQDVRTENGVLYGDLPQFVDYEYLRKNTYLNLATIACLANAPSSPEDIKISISQLSNDTHIYWQPPKYGRAKGYYVLMRETDASMWQKKFYTDSTEITLPFSRDNFFFAVQAVGDDGLMSVPVFPGIGR
ncbi:MAG: M28 family metallopeptidase [Chitinophagaceae bacterium]